MHVQMDADAYAAKLVCAIFSCALLIFAARRAAAQPSEETPSEASETKPQKPLSELTLEELLQVPITTIATATPRPTSETPSLVTVITARDIEAMGATTVEEALESVPGLHVSFSAQAYRPKYIIRGVSSRFTPQVLVMQNGVPITNPLTGGVRTLSLPVEMVSRIEVIRGPGSAVWGADAVAGVINIVTKSADDLDGTVLGARAGSFTTGSGWILHGDHVEDWKILLGVQGFSTAGHGRTLEADALHDTPNARFSLAPGPVNVSGNAANVLLDLEKGSWRLRGSYQSLWNSGTGQGVATVLDPYGKLYGGRTLVDLTYQPKLSKDWELTPRAAYFHEQDSQKNLNLFPPGTNLGSGSFPQGVIGNPEYFERRVQGDVSVLYKRWSEHRFRAGAGYSFAQVYRVRNSKNSTPTFAPLPGPGLTDVSDTPDSQLPDTYRHNVSGLLQDEWSFAKDWELTVGARYDYYSDFGGSFNPRQSLLWKISPALTTRFFYGHAFRAPAAIELYSRNNVSVIGNRNLKPEQIDVFEAAVDFSALRRKSG